MKNCFKNSKPRARKDFSFFRYFNTTKSPHTQINPIIRTYDYYPKHAKPAGVVVWGSGLRGTYVRAKHGELSLKNLR